MIWAHGGAFFRRVGLRVSRFSRREELGTRIGSMRAPFCDLNELCWTSSGPESVLSDVCAMRADCHLPLQALGQYEQGGSLGSPILSSAVLSTRHHRGAGCALPRHIPTQGCRLPSRIERVFWFCQEISGQIKASTEPRHYGREGDVPLLRSGERAAH